MAAANKPPDGPGPAEDESLEPILLPVDAIYKKLAEPFEHTFKDQRGGFSFDYITGEQATTRLNEVLGVNMWSTRVLEHGYNQEADEIWCLIEIEAEIMGKVVRRQQFGSQKIKRSRTTDSPLDIGFDLKGATTDALKKSATLLGVALYLSHKEAVETANAANATPQSNSTGSQPLQGSQAAQNAGIVQLPSNGESYTCEQCDEELKEIRFRDGTTWTPALLASYGRRKHGKVLCMQHYREANESRKKADAAPASMDEVPF